MKRDRFANQRENLFLRFASRDAARKIRDICSIGTWPFFDDNKVSHALHCSILNRACLLCFISTDPVVRLPVLVGYRDDKNMVLFHGVHHLIWKLVQKTLPDFTPLYGPRFRIFGNL